MQTNDAVAVLSALAQEARLDTFRALVQAGPDGMPAGAIAKALEIPAATLSFHLKELRIAGIVTCRREGRSIIYSPNFDAMNELLGFLTKNCCQGTGSARERSRKAS